MLACLCLFLFIGCDGLTSESGSGEQTQEQGQEQRKDLVLLDYTNAECITLEKFYLPLDTAERSCPVETVSKEINDGQAAMKAVRKIYAGRISEVKRRRI